MPFCTKCGNAIPDNAAFCPNCGASAAQGGYSGGAAAAPSAAGETEFDRLTKDARTQDLWLKRVIAYIIDAIIVGIAAGIISLILFLIIGVGIGLTFFGSILYPFSAFTGVSGLLFVAYFTLADYYYHRTIGKSLMNLRVTTTDGSRLDIGKALIRNISKIYWLFLLLDLIIWFVTHIRPGQKLTDHIANTNVVFETGR